MRKTVERILQQANIGAGDPLVAAVSGGVDSLVLLHILCGLRASIGYRLTVVHIDHAMREESADDAAYVAELCRQWEVSCIAMRVDVPARIERTGESPEEAARNARYACLRQAADGAKIVLAHHAGDQAETVILHLLRGSGTDGLTAMEAVERDLVRPLLTYTKEDLVRYAQLHGIEPREDKTNQDETYLRNRVRLSLLPELRTYQPQIDDALCRLADIAREEQAYLDAVTNEMWEKAVLMDGCALDRARFREIPLAIQRRIVRKWIGTVCTEELLSLAHCDRIREHILLGRNGASCPLPDGSRIVCEYDKAVRRTETTEAFTDRTEAVLSAPTASVRWHGLTIMAAVQEEGPAQIGSAVFDLALVKFPLTVRSRRMSDRFFPRGGAGTKKLKDFFIDCKIPAGERDAVPIFLDADGRILWVGGIRASEAARPNQQTKQYLTLTIQKE